MSQLSATLIDVGWGDSILLEFVDDHDHRSYALIDSNDTTYYRSSYIFLKRFFERRGMRLPDDKPVFDFVMLSHAHADHGQGLKAIMKDFGTRRLWYPKSTELSGLAYLLDYANKSTNVEHHESLNSGKHTPDFGGAQMGVLWPPYDHIDGQNENNNSIVFTLDLDTVTFVFTGDAEAEVWNQIAAQIPPSTRLFKVPHHGSRNGTFGGNAHNPTPWLSQCPAQAQLGISAHIRPFRHPHAEVIAAFQNDNWQFYRTDDHHHVTFTTDGNTVAVKYSHE